MVVRIRSAGACFSKTGDDELSDLLRISLLGIDLLGQHRTSDNVRPRLADTLRAHSSSLVSPGLLDREPNHGAVLLEHLVLSDPLQRSGQMPGLKPLAAGSLQDLEHACSPPRLGRPQSWLIGQQLTCQPSGVGGAAKRNLLTRRRLRLRRAEVVRYRRERCR
jgi:hypothetical protein